MRTLTFTKPGKHKVTVGAGQRVKIKVLQLAAESAPLTVSVELTGAEAEAIVYGVFVNRGDAENALHCTLHHRAPHTRGRVLVKGVARDHAREHFNGMIKIDPGAQDTESFLEHRALIADAAEVYPTPSLEIGANQVRASHAAAVTHLNDLDRFYLTVRGIPPERADRILTRSFLAEVLAALTPSEQRQVTALL